ncbi:MAG: FtsX-like permease family protein [Bacteroidota bacterium]
MFRLNLKIALRNLWKNKGFTLINVSGLAIGLASCLVLLLYVAYEWGYDKQFKGYENSYIVYTNQQTSDGEASYAWTPALMAPELKAKIPGVKYASHSTYPESHLIGLGENRFKTNAVFADHDFLKILDYKFLKGDAGHALQNINSVIITESLAKKLFGSEDPINKSLRLDNEDILNVEGVIADVPRNSTIQFEYLMPWALFEEKNSWVKDMEWGGMFCLSIIQMEKNANVNAITSGIKGIYKRNDKGTKNDALVHPLAKWHLYGDFQNGKSVGGKITQVKTLFILAVCILLIACINFINLSTARSEKRGKEVGVRKVIGSTRKMLVSQFMLESYLLTFIALVLALIFTEVSLPYFNRLLNSELTIDYSDWNVWGVLMVLTMFTGFIAGGYPAFYLSAFDPVSVLKGLGKASGTSAWIRKVLVITQFGFAAMLIICTIVIYQQINYIKNKPLGYSKNNLMQINLIGALQGAGKISVLKAELLKTGAITNVTSLSRSITKMGHRAFNISWPGKSDEESILFNYRNVGYNFMETIGAELVAGREFSPDFKDSANVILNETAVKVMGLKNPLRSVVKWGDVPATVIGVVKDFIVESPFEKTLPMIIGHNDNNSAVLLVRLSPDKNLSQSVLQLDNVIKKFNPGFPVERNFVNDDFENSFQNERLLGTLSNWFGGFAIFISCLGLLGLVLYMAEQRKKEISIRKVLGATNLSILNLLNRDFIKLVIIANLIAFPIAYIAVNKWLSSYEFRVSISAVPFLVAIILSVLINVVTVSIQSIKVAKANPIDALKYE